jgi:hypothetical protein
MAASAAMSVDLQSRPVPNPPAAQGGPAIGRRGFLAGALAFALPSAGEAAELPSYSGQLRTVRTHSELRRAIAVARPGDRILLKPGTYYGTELSIVRSGTESRPIQIVAETLHAAEMRTAFAVLGSDWTFWGLSWVNYARVGDLIHVHAPRVTVLRCRFLDYASADPERAFGAISVRGGAEGCSIGYNEFQPFGYKYEYCESVYNRGRRGGIRVSAYDARNVPRGVRIWRNHFHDFPSKSAPLASQDIACGLVGPMSTYKVRKPSCLVLGETATTAPISLGALVEYNLFERCNQGSDSNAMETKSSDNIIRFNHFMNCYSYFGILQGYKNQLIGNRFEDSLRMIIQSHGGLAVGNVTRGSTGRHLGLELFAGQVGSTTTINNRMPAAGNVTLVGGDYHRLCIGRAYNGYTHPAADLTFRGVRVRGILLTAANYRTLPGVIHQVYDPLSLRFTADPGRTVPLAVRLARSNVGPLALWRG